MFIIQLSVLFLYCTIIDVEPARILAIYPCPSISHQIVFRPITLELIKRGYEVTVLTPDPMFSKGKTPQNLTEIDVHEISYEFIKKKFASSITGRKTDLINQVRLMLELPTLMLEEQMNTKGFQELISNKTESFDLILLEAMFSTALGISHRFNAPIILVSSFGPFFDSYGIMGAPSHPILYHNNLRQRLYNLTLWEKIIETYNQYKFKRIFSSIEDDNNKMLKRVFGPTVPPLTVLKDNIDMLFVNIDPIWEGNYPVPPNVIHMGGLHQKPTKQLPHDLQQYLDNSEKGVIYFSFGTNVKPSLLPKKSISLFQKVFSQLPYNVIWKWDSENFSVSSSNIKVLKWLPQSDLLRHPKVKVFITQGGLQSTDEAITAGVPLIGIPMLVDQWYNVEKYVYHQIGVKLELEDLTEDLLKNAILDVAENERYRNNIARLRSIMQDQPQTPLERTMWWIEYVLRHGGAKHLRAPAANMSWTDFLELELVGVVLLSSFLTIVLGFFVIRYLVSFLVINVLQIEKIKTM